MTNEKLQIEKQIENINNELYKNKDYFFVEEKIKEKKLLEWIKLELLE